MNKEMYERDICTSELNDYDIYWSGESAGYGNEASYLEYRLQGQKSTKDTQCISHIFTCLVIILGVLAYSVLYMLLTM